MSYDLGCLNIKKKVIFIKEDSFSKLCYHPENRAGGLIRFIGGGRPRRFDGRQAKVTYFNGPLFRFLLVHERVKLVDARAGVFVLVMRPVMFLHTIGFFGYKKYVIRLKITMQNVTSVQIFAAGSCLLHYVNKLMHFPMLFFYMHVTIQARTGAPFGDDGQVGLEYASDERENVVVAGRL